MPISDCWPALEASLELLDEPTAKRITSLHAHLSPLAPQITRYATSIHPKNLPCRLITSTYTWGQSFLVYELVFDPEAEGSEPQSWVARFGLPPYEGDEFFNTPEQLERKIMNEVGALRVVKARTTVPVPTIFGYCARHGDDFQRKFGGEVVVMSGARPHTLGEPFPAFILMSALRGKTIEDCGIPVHELGGHWEAPAASPDSVPYFTSPILKNYLASLADIHMQLSQITFPQIGGFTVDDETGDVQIGPMADFGLGPFDTAQEYYATLAEAFRRIADAAEEEEDDDAQEEDVEISVDGGGETITLSQAQIQALRRTFTATLYPLALGPHVSASNDAGPFPLRHGDLHSENILVDEETGSIIGIIDWEGAGTVPWEVAGGLNWEVQGDAEANDVQIERSEIHAAFNRALRQVEAERDALKPKLVTPTPPPASIRLDHPIPEPETPTRPKLTFALKPEEVASTTSIASTTSSSSSEHSSDFESFKSHSRSSSSSKSNLTGFTSPATSPASSMFSLASKVGSIPEDIGESNVRGPTSILSSISFLNTPSSPPSFKSAFEATFKRFSRSVAPPPTDTPRQEDRKNLDEHSRSVSLCPVVLDGVREPLPADYLKQMVNKSQLSLSLATLHITAPESSPTDRSFPSSTRPHTNDGPGSPYNLTPPTQWNTPSVVLRTPNGVPHIHSPLAASPGLHPPRHRGVMHRRKQSSIALGSLPPYVPGSPVNASPAIPFCLYGPQPHAPPPLLAESLSLPPLPRRRTPSPAPDAAFAQGSSALRGRSPSPRPVTPQSAHASVHPNPHPHPHPHMRNNESMYSSWAFARTPRTPTSSRPNSMHLRAHSASTTTTPLHSAASPPSSYFLPPSLSRSVSASYGSGNKTSGTVTPPTPHAPLAPLQLPEFVPFEVQNPFEEPAVEVAPSPKVTTSTTTGARVEPAVVEDTGSAKATAMNSTVPRAPSGASLSELHGATGSYVASYLAHWMFVFGCDYETVGKALWEVVLHTRRNGDAQDAEQDGDEDVEDAFWAWAKKTLGNRGEEQEEEDQKGGVELDMVEPCGLEATSPEVPAQAKTVSTAPTSSTPVTEPHPIATPQKAMLDALD